MNLNLRKYCEIKKQFLKRSSIILLFFSIFAFLPSCSKEKKVERLVSNGTLDLRKSSGKEYDFEKDGLLNLKGDWKFYWNELIPTDCTENCSLSPPVLLTVPKKWNDLEVKGQKLPGKGFGTYELKILLEKPEPQLCIKTNFIGSAYEIFVNGERITGGGKVSPIEAQSSPGYNKSYFPLKDSDTEFTILIHVSNYHHRNGGIWEPFQIGRMVDFQYATFRKQFLDFFLFGSLLFMGIYHVGLFILRRKDKHTIWFGIYSLLICFRIFLAGEGYLYNLLPDYWNLLFRLEYLSFYLAVPIFSIFLQTLYPNEFPYRNSKIFGIIGLLFCLPVLTLPSSEFSKTVVAFQVFMVLSAIYAMYVLIFAARNKRQGANLILIGWILFVLATVNDILYYNFIINSIVLAPFGFFLFNFSQAFVLSKLLSKAFSQVEYLSENLEKQVALRTVELSEEKERAIAAQKETSRQKKETEELNKLIKRLNEELDLNVIMKKVMDYVKHTFGIIHFGLYVMNEEKNGITLIENTFPPYVNEEDRKKILDFKIPLNSDLGAHSFTFRSKRPFFVANVQSPKILSKTTSEELFVIQKFRIESFLMIPLSLQNEPIGILDLFNEERMDIPKDQINRMSILGEQLAGIIYGSKLFRQVQEEKEKAVLARKEIQRQKQETEDLNKLIKSLNEELDLKIIMKKVMAYVLHNFKIYQFALYGVSPDKKHLILLDASFPESIDQDIIDLIYEMKVPITDVKGAHALAIHAQRPFYLPKIKKFGITKEEEFVIEKVKMKSFLMIPLILQNEPIGVLDFSNEGELILSRDDISRLSILGEQITGIIYGSKLFRQVQEEQHKSEKLLLNILPFDVAKELKEKGAAEPVLFDSVSVLFTDFKGFTQIAESMSPGELVKELDACFVQFDKITERFRLEKLKTIGDSYMCAGGIPRINSSHAIDSVLAAIEIQNFMNMMKSIKESQGFPYWEIRLGIHTGPLIAGVIGEKKFAYDVWGDTVNTASRMESSGIPGRINISGTTYELIKEYFDCEYRGKVNAKNKGEVDMYFVNGIKLELSKEGDKITPNEDFWELYSSSEHRSA